MLTSIVIAAAVGIGALVCIFAISFFFSTRPLIKCVVESVLTALILLLLVTNIVMGAEDTCNYYTLGAAGFIACIYVVMDWRDYRDWKSWF